MKKIMAPKKFIVGFTIVELMISLGIFSTIFLIIGILYRDVNSTQVIENEKAQVNEARAFFLQNLGCAQFRNVCLSNPLPYVIPDSDFTFTPKNGAGAPITYHETLKMDLAATCVAEGNYKSLEIIAKIKCNAGINNPGCDGVTQSRDVTIFDRYHTPCKYYYRLNNTNPSECDASLGEFPVGITLDPSTLKYEIKCSSLPLSVFKLVGAGLNCGPPVPDPPLDFNFKTLQGVILNVGDSGSSNHTCSADFRYTPPSPLPLKCCVVQNPANGKWGIAKCSD